METRRSPDEQPPAESYRESRTPEKLKARRRLEVALQRQHEEFIALVDDQERRLQEIENRKGILERLFGIRTQVP